MDKAIQMLDKLKENLSEEKSSKEKSSKEESTKEKSSKKWNIETISSLFFNYHTKQYFYLYLVDEFTGKPVNSSEMKVELTPTQLSKFVPVMMVGWKCICTVNEGLSILKLFYPVPNVASEKMQQITDSITSMSEKSELLQTAAENGSNTVVRGKSLREFSDFLLKHDKEKEFGGLCRVFNSQNGNAMWVTDESAEKMKDTNNLNNVIKLEKELAAAKQELAAPKKELAATKKKPSIAENKLKVAFSILCLIYFIFYAWHSLTVEGSYKGVE